MFFFRDPIGAAISGALALSSIAFPSVCEAASSCKCFPGESCWPTDSVWSDFNSTISGRLIKTVPLGTPCHDPNYDGATCQTLQDTWTDPETHYGTSSSIMAPFWANQSCDPFQPEARPCVLGTYVRYAVNVTEAADVSQTLAFAEKYNIRVVIRNTGHDYNGKSTGAGAVALWMHNLKTIEFKDVATASYTGKAIKMGAGVQAFEAYYAAQQQGLAVVGGECETVGLAGGYSQGGGHSSLSSKYGLGADQVLEVEAVDGSGNYLIANETTNSDLFWAVRGGGGSAYAVVLSMTSKAHPDITISGANLTFTDEGITQDTYYEAVGYYHSMLTSLVDAGAMSVWFFTNASFTISPLVAPGVSAAELTALLQPFMDKLTELGIAFSHTVLEFTSFREEFLQMQGAVNVGIAQYGGWLIPRSVVETNNAALTEVYRDINNAGGTFIGVGLNVSKAVVGDVDNAVNPAWRDTLIDTVITTPWNFTAPWADMVALQKTMTDDFIPQLTALAPDSGVYLNEADPFQPSWQQAYYGGYYDRLLAVKAKYDPKGLFYARGAVGSDQFVEEEDGHLCTA